MTSLHFGEIVLRLIVIVRLQQRKRACPEVEVVENNRFQTLHSGCPWHDAGSAGRKALRGEAYAHSTLLLAKQVAVPQVTDAELVHRSCAKRLRVSEIHQLRPSIRKRVETRHIGATLLGGIGIIQMVLCASLV